MQFLFCIITIFKEIELNWHQVVKVTTGNISNMDSKTVDLLVEKGLVKVFNFDFPVNQEKRHFSDDFYVRKLPNGEKARRDWLVYSKKTDSVFGF